MQGRVRLPFLCLLILSAASATKLSDHLKSYSSIFVSRLPPASWSPPSSSRTLSSIHNAFPSTFQDHESWLISAFGHQFQLELHRNLHLIPSTYATYTYTDNNTLEAAKYDDLRHHCHFYGTVKPLATGTGTKQNASASAVGEVAPSASFVAVSLCDGALHGEIRTGSHHFFIEPASLHFTKEAVDNVRKDCLHGGKWTKGGFAELASCLEHRLHLKDTLFHLADNVWSEKAVPHIAYRVEDLKEDQHEYSCGVDGGHHELFDESIMKASVAEITHKHWKPLSVEAADETLLGAAKMDTQYIEDVKYVELMVVNDRSRYVDKGSNRVNVERHTETLVNIAASRYRAANLFPEIVLVLTAQITIVSPSDPWSAPKCPGSATETDHSTLLDTFLAWAWGTTPRQHIDSNINYDNIHLFTALDFCGGTVGFAPVGSMCYGSKSGGINQMTFADQQSANIITHEMGHNFNMLHDGTASENTCPSAGYIMASSGCLTCSSWVTDFSTCSKGYYSSLMQYRPTSTACLDNKPVFVFGDPSCGDGFVEGNEECDCGSSNCASTDPCCNGATCRLYPGADCSNSQSCCSNCRIVPRSENKVCRKSFNSVCDVPEVCDGLYADCPANTYNAPGTVCTDDAGNSNGRCYQGGCLTHAVQCRGIYEKNVGACGSVNCGGALTCSVTDKTTGINECTAFQAVVGEGTPCGAGSQCYEGRCVLSTALYYSWSIYCDMTCSGQITREYRCKKFDGTFVIDSLCSGVRPNATSSGTCGSFAPQICSVNVTTSTGGSVTLGDTVTIVWKTLRQVDFVSILVYTSGTEMPEYVKVSQGDVGRYVWTIPRGLPAGTQSIEVVVSPSVSARGDKTFTSQDQCQATACQNSGTCENGVCQCIGGFQGELCGSTGCMSPTTGQDCMNGASCHSSTLKCVCPTGFEGSFCQYRPQSCTTSCGANSEPNANCTCTCKDFYSGSNCDTCSLTCVRGTREGCSSCKCDAWTWGQRCDAFYANVTINFKGLNTQRLLDNKGERLRFVRNLQQEIGVVIGVETSKIIVDDRTLAKNGTTASVRLIVRGSDLQVSTMETILTRLVDGVKNPYSDVYRFFVLKNVDASAGLIIEGDGLFKGGDKRPWYVKVMDWMRNNLKIVIPVAVVILLLVLYKVHSDSRANQRRKMAGVNDPEAVHIQVHHKVRPNGRAQEQAVDDEEEEALQKKSKKQKVKPKKAAPKKKRKSERKLRGEDELADEFGVRVVTGQGKGNKAVNKDLDADDLPPNWSVQYFEDGTPFYFNSVTNDISTSKPMY